MMPHAGPSFSSNKGSSQNTLLPPSCGGISEISYLWLCSIAPQVLADKCKCQLLGLSIKSNSSVLAHTGALKKMVVSLALSTCDNGKKKHTCNHVL